MMQMKTSDDIGKINTLHAHCNRYNVILPFFRQKNAQTVWMAMKCKIINFDAIFYVLLTSIVLKS